MKCSYCAKDIEPSMKYCPYCGKLVVQNTPLDKYLNDNENNAAEPKDKFDDVFNSYEHIITNDIDSSSKQEVAADEKNNEKIHLIPNLGEKLKNISHSKNIEDDSSLEGYEMPKIFNPDNFDEDLVNTPQESKSILEKIKSAPNNIPHFTKKESSVSQESPIKSEKADIPSASDETPFTYEKSDANENQHAYEDVKKEDVNFVLLPDNKFSQQEPADTDPLHDLNLNHEDITSLYTSAKTNKPQNNKYRPPSYKSPKIDKKLRKIVLLIVAITLILIIGILSYMYLIHNKPSLIQNTTTIEAGVETDLLSLVSLENEDNYTVAVKSDSIDYMVLGEYKVIYTITNEENGKTYDEEFSFNVVDTTPPTITVSDTLTVQKDSDFDIMDNISVADSVDGIIDNSSVTMTGTIDATVNGTYPVTLSVTDNAGNTATKDISIIVEDNSDPTAFFNQIDAVWKFTNTQGKILTIYKDSGKYMMNVGYEANEGYGGEFTFKSLSSDNSTAVFNWTFTDEEGTQTIDVNVDLGTPNDRKMKMDFGNGWEDLIYYKALS